MNIRVGETCIGLRNFVRRHFCVNRETFGITSNPLLHQECVRLALISPQQQNLFSFENFLLSLHRHGLGFCFSSPAESLKPCFHARFFVHQFCPFVMICDETHVVKKMQSKFRLFCSSVRFVMQDCDVMITLFTQQGAFAV